MEQILLQFLHNKKQPVSSLEQKLGSSAKVHAFAAFYNEHAEELAIALAVALYDYTSDPDNVVDTKDVVAFKSGLSVLPKLFEDCFKEIEAKRLAETSSEDDIQVPVSDGV